MKIDGIEFFLQISGYLSLKSDENGDAAHV